MMTIVRLNYKKTLTFKAFKKSKYFSLKYINYFPIYDSILSKFRNKKIISIELDPRHETADTDFSNNFFPSRITKSRIELYKSNFKRRDLMADMLEKLRKRKTGNDDSLRSVPLENTN